MWLNWVLSVSKDRAHDSSYWIVMHLKLLTSTSYFSFSWRNAYCYRIVTLWHCSQLGIRILIYEHLHSYSKQLSLRIDNSVFLVVTLSGSNCVPLLEKLIQSFLSLQSSIHFINPFHWNGTPFIHINGFYHHSVMNFKTTRRRSHES